jgi:hypothetical protein
MIKSLLRFGTGVVFVMVLLSPSAGQDKDQPKKDKALPAEPPPKERDDYRQYFKKPETINEYWKAMQFEIELGEYGLAAKHLRGLLAKPPTDEDLIQLEAKYGTAAFMKLRTIRRWSDKDAEQKQALDDVEELNRLVVAAVKKKLADRDRIVKLVRALNAEPEEATFAFKELYPYRGAVVPVLIDEMKPLPAGDERRKLKRALTRFAPDVVPPLVAALDSNDTDLIIDVIGVLMDRRAREVVPYLWYLSASPDHSERVHEKATEALAFLLDVPRSKLPPAKVALAREAERYRQHQVPFLDPAAVLVWRWDPKAGIVRGWPGAEFVPATKAEEYWGLRFAREALAIDPSFRPAQETLLALALEKALEADDLSRPLSKVSPAVHELVTTINPDVIVAVLEKALTEQRSTVALGCVRALGELAEVRASKPTGHGEPALVRALDYGDKRVQMAAAESLLRMPSPPSSQATQRILKILARNLADAGREAALPRALVASGDDDARLRIGAAVTKAGFEPVPVKTGRDALRRINARNDISAIVLESTLPDPGLASFLAQVKADVNAGRLPVILIAVPDNVATRDLIVQYRDAKDRVDFLIRKSAAYRKKRLEMQIKYEEDRTNLAKTTAGVKEAERNELFALLDLRIKNDLAELAKQYPDAAIFDKDAQDAEKKLRTIADKYSVECQRREIELQRWLEGSPTVSVVSLDLLDEPTRLQSRLRGEDGKTETRPLTEAEQKEYTEKAVRYFARMARGELAGYDIKEYADLIYNALRSGKLSKEGQADAIDIVGRLTSGRSQAELAAVILGNAPPELRVKATDELVKHIQTNSLMLNDDMKGRLRKLYDDLGQAAEAQDFRAKLAVLLGSLRPTSQTTGERLRDYQPPPPKMGP